MSRARVVTLSVLFFLVAVGGGAIGRAYFAEPGPWTDYVGQINAYVEEHEPEGDAAWPVYREMIIERFGIESAEDEDYAPLYERILTTLEYDFTAGSWGETRHDAARALIADGSDVLGALDEAATRPRMGKRYVRKGDTLTGEQDEDAVVAATDVLLPEMKHLRLAGMLNIVAARDAAHRDDWDAFARRIESGVALGQHLSRIGIILELAIGQHIIAKHAEAVRYALNDRALPVAVCERLDRTLDLDLRASAEHCMHVERLIMRSSFESMHDPGGWLVIWRVDPTIGGAFQPIDRDDPPTAWHRLANVLTYFQDDLDETIRRYEGIHDAYLAAVEAPPPAFAAEANDATASRLMNSVIGATLPSYGRYLQLTRSVERDLLATRIMLRLEIAHARTGAWPESLDAPEFAELNEDSMTGQPFVYQRLAGDPHGRTYTLMSPDSALQGFGATTLNPPRPSLEEDDAN